MNASCLVHMLDTGRQANLGRRLAQSTISHAAPAGGSHEPRTRSDTERAGVSLINLVSAPQRLWESAQDIHDSASPPL
jgi:hypothetical protein